MYFLVGEFSIAFCSGIEVYMETMLDLQGKECACFVSIRLNNSKLFSRCADTVENKSDKRLERSQASFVVCPFTCETIVEVYF